MSRLFTGRASAYSAGQVQQAKVRRQQVRTVRVDFNGALEPGDLIASATWSAASPWITAISDAEIAADRRSSSVRVLFNYAGYGDVKCTITDDSGSMLNYEFMFTVTNCPIYPDDVYPDAAGPYSITVVAP